jgi:hypothetical protein
VINPELDPDQIALLLQLAELQESTPKAERGTFYFLRNFGDSGHVQHKQLPNGQLPAYRGDVDILVEAGFFKKTMGYNGGLGFVVSPSGVAHARSIREAQGEPNRQLEHEVLRWIATESFAKRYPAVHQRWIAAGKLLNEGFDEAKATSIRHLCREAMQLFAARLVEDNTAPDASADPAKTVSRLRAVLTASKSLRDTPMAFLESLVAYWGALSDLVQRQEHGAFKEGEKLAPEDARLVVFYTFLVMFEVDRYLHARS